MMDGIYIVQFKSANASECSKTHATFTNSHIFIHWWQRLPRKLLTSSYSASYSKCSTIFQCSTFTHGSIEGPSVWGSASCPRRCTTCQSSWATESGRSHSHWTHHCIQPRTANFFQGADKELFAENEQEITNKAEGIGRWLMIVSHITHSHLAHCLNIN